MKIVILGAGNVAYHFVKAIGQISDVELVQLYNRSQVSAHFLPYNILVTHDISKLENADMYLVCVKDKAIRDISQRIDFQGKLVVHTSGNTSIDELSNRNRRGVLYPVQSFSKDKQMDFGQIPLCVEAENQQDEKILLTFARKLSSEVYLINSIQRKYLHISAVFMNNFANHMWYLSQKICQENAIDFDILKPLLSETFAKIQSMSFYEAQTGPARRNDISTLDKHVSLLEGTSKEIYKIITNSILNTYVRKEL